ncbi:MAG: hypothetical protein ACXQS8_09815 [Candidatus Helarchaeales archaeon]
MNKRKNVLIIVSVIIIVSISVFTLTFVVVFFSSPKLSMHSYSGFFDISASSYNFIGSSAYNPGEETFFEFSSNVSVEVYLLSEEQFHYFYETGTIGQYLQAIMGTTGNFYVKHERKENVILLFIAVENTHITHITTEYRYN